MSLLYNLYFAYVITMFKKYILKKFVQYLLSKNSIINYIYDPNIYNDFL
ncbi:hypothetical protein pb186bvf_014925 [Paramecium bursaria]